MVAKLLVMKLFKERPLRRDEEDMLKAVSTNLESGTQISMPRSRFLTLYRYSDTPADTLLQSVFPCSEFVIPTTGDVASAKSRVKTPCGQQRYCRQCEKVFKVLDQSYPTYVVCDVLLALLTKILPTWSGKAMVDSAMWARQEVPGRNHKCGAGCSGNL